MTATAMGCVLSCADEELMRRKQQEQSGEAAAALVLRYLLKLEGWVAGWGAAYHLQEADVSDIYQELALEVAPLLDRFDAARADDGKPNPVARYCYAALHRRFTNRLRCRWRAERHYDRSGTAADRLEALAGCFPASPDWLTPPPAAEDNPLVAAQKAEAVAALRQALAGLTRADQQLLQMHAYGVPLTRIAARLGQPYDTLRRRLPKLLTDLRARLASWR